MTDSNIDKYQRDRMHLADLTDEQLKEKFWHLAEDIVAPLMELGRKNTTPSIERSILMRMGFSSLEVRPIVEGVIDRGLMGKGAGHVVYQVAKQNDLSIRDAGLALIQGEYWSEVVEFFSGGTR